MVCNALGLAVCHLLSLGRCSGRSPGLLHLLLLALFLFLALLLFRTDPKHLFHCPTSG